MAQQDFSKKDRGMGVPALGSPHKPPVSREFQTTTPLSGIFQQGKTPPGTKPGCLHFKELQAVRGTPP